MEGILALVGFIAIWIFIENRTKERHKNGDTLKSIPKTYFLAIKNIISPYQTTSFASQIISTSQQVLKNLLNRYNSFKEQGTLKDSDIEKFFVENYTDTYFVENFALIYVFSFKPYYAGLIPSDEDKFAEKSAKEYCKNKLLLRKNDIPDTIWYSFDIDKERF